MGTTPDLAKKIVIAPGAKMQKSFSDKAPYDGYNMSTMLFESVMVDKAIVVYNNERKTEFKMCSTTFDCNSEPRNIFNLTFNNEEKEIYTITNDDYLNASPCNGNCY